MPDNAKLLTVSASGDADREQSVELLALVQRHPASEQETRDRANRLLNELKSSLSPETVAVAQERGKARELDTILVEMLQVLS